MKTLSDLAQAKEKPKFSPALAEEKMAEILSDGFAVHTMQYSHKNLKIEAMFYLPTEMLRSFQTNFLQKNPHVSPNAVALALYLRELTITMAGKPSLELKDIPRDFEKPATLIPTDSKAFEERVNRIGSLPAGIVDQLSKLLYEVLLLDRYLGGHVDEFGNPIEEDPFRVI